MEALEETTRAIWLVDRSNINTKRITLLEIAQYNQRVYEIAKKANDVVAVPVLCQCVNYFYLFTASSFSIVLATIDDVYEARNFTTALWVVVSTIAFLVMFVLSHNCMQKVSNTTRLTKNKRFFK